MTIRTVTNSEAVAEIMNISTERADELLEALRQYEQHAIGSIWDRAAAHDQVLEAMQRIMAHLAVRARQTESLAQRSAAQPPSR